MATLTDYASYSVSYRLRNNSGTDADYLNRSVAGLNANPNSGETDIQNIYRHWQVFNGIVFGSDGLSSIGLGEDSVKNVTKQVLVNP